MLENVMVLALTSSYPTNDVQYLSDMMPYESKNFIIVKFLIIWLPAQPFSEQQSQNFGYSQEGGWDVGSWTPFS